MNPTKATKLIYIQLDKLNNLDYNSYKAWTSQTSSYLKDIFGEESDEYKFMKNFSFLQSYDDDHENIQIKSRTPSVRIHLENCIESIEHRGINQSKKEAKETKESWTKKYPLIFEIVKSIIILLVGYFFRVITEPKYTPIENKTNTEQSLNKSSKK